MLAATTAAPKSIVGMVLLVAGVLLKIFGGAIADRLAADRPGDCGPSG